MRLRVTATMERQLRERREAKSNKRRGGVMVVPPMMNADEWEQLAGPYEDWLIGSATEDRRKNTDPQPTAPVDPNIEHNRWNRAQWEHTRRGATDYLDAKRATIEKPPARKKTVVR